MRTAVTVLAPGAGSPGLSLRIGGFGAAFRPCLVAGKKAPVLIVVIVLLAIAALVVIGWLVVGLALKLLWWALIGLVIGALARLILPGKQNLSILATAGAGVAAALLGGIVAHALDLGNVLQFVIALVLAVALVAVLGGTRFARA